MSQQWQCSKCTLNNDLSALRCIICDNRQPRNLTFIRRKRSLSPANIEQTEPCSKRIKLDTKHKHTHKNQRKLNKKHKHKKKNTKPLIRTIYEAIINNSLSEREKRNGLTISKIVTYIKYNNDTTENIDRKILTSEVTQVIKEGLRRGVIQNNISNTRYKITNLGTKEHKSKKYSKQYDINNLNEQQKAKERSRNKIKTKYNEKYYNNGCKFDDELDEQVVNKMSIEHLKINLKYRALRWGGPKKELKKRLKNYLNNTDCINSNSLKELKQHLKAMNKNKESYKFEHKSTRKLFDTLVKINEEYMSVEIPSIIWRFIALYGAGIKAKCSSCDTELYVLDGCAKNEIINDEYWILHIKYFKENKNKCVRDLHKFAGRLFCDSCYWEAKCCNCEYLMSPNDYLYGGDFDGCVKCGEKLCNQCNDKWYDNEVDWCYRAGVPCCNWCLSGLEMEEKEW